MKTKTLYEEQMIHEMQALPVSMQKKIVRLVRVFREEMIASIDDEKKATDQFLSVCGSWKDKRSVDDQIRDTYNSRRSRKEMENLS